jgi:hypothetical protein
VNAQRVETWSEALDYGLLHTMPRRPGLPDPATAGQRAVALMGAFDKVVAEGTVDEKRAFIRAFVHQVQVSPESRQTHLLLRELPQLR